MPVRRRKFVRRRRVYRRKRTLATKSRPRYKRRYLRKNVTIVPQVGVADSMFCKLKYSTRAGMGTGSTAVTICQIRGNGPYDPEVAIGGSQPDFWNTYSPNYRTYLCFASKVKVTYMQQSATATNNVIWGVTPAPSNYDYSTAIWPELQEYRYTKSRITGTSNNSGTVQTIKYYMHASSVFGIPKKRISMNNQYAGPIDGLPGNQWYWTVWSQCQDETTAVSGIVNIRVTYYIKFYDPNITF